MRYLNKIVFINSANIRYAEVCLDGNVHFIGTQGVGKSTILRAILFSTMPISRNSAYAQWPGRSRSTNSISDTPTPISSMR